MGIRRLVEEKQEEVEVLEMRDRREAEVEAKEGRGPGNKENTNKSRRHKREGYIARMSVGKEEVQENKISLRKICEKDE